MESLAEPRKSLAVTVVAVNEGLTVAISRFAVLVDVAVALVVPLGGGEKASFQGF